MNDTTKPSEYLGYWGEKYKNDLLTDILPFWLKYGIDHENGGYFTCLDRDGSLLDTNKSVWFQDGSPLFSLMLTTTSKNRPNGWKPVKTGSTLSRNIVSIQTAACFTR